MTQRTSLYKLHVASTLYHFIDQQVLPGTGVSSVTFWKGFDQLVQDLAPKNKALLAERDRLQTALDQWHAAHPGPVTDMKAYQAFLHDIGYLVPVPAKAKATPNIWRGRMRSSNQMAEPQAIKTGAAA